MDKYINKLVRGFRKIFNKKYVAVVSIFVGLIAVLGFTYGYLSDESGWQLAYQLRASELYYTMTIDGNSVSTITAPANSTTYHDIVITSLNDVNTRYSLTYTSSSNVIVNVSSESINRQEGVIGLYTTGTVAEKTKTIRVAITNNNGADKKVTFNVAGGYTWNPENEVAILDGYNRITGLIAESNMSYGLTLAQEVSSLLNCTPTSTMPCLFKENANNYLTLDGQTWRIIGSYLIGTENVVKLILNSNYETLTTYGNKGTVHTAILNAMSSQAKALLRSSTPFACTGTSTITCSGGNGTVNSISKVEYNLVGGVNSYLYTKPGENYWTYDSRYAATSRGISGNLSTTAEAYVRPAVYLKENVVRVSGDGSQEQPYVVTMGYHLTINGMTNATTNLPSGYYAPGQTYVINAPVHTDQDYFFNAWLVSGTGASVSGTTFTMGTADTTLTATWGKEFEYNGSYGTFVASESGYYFVEAFGAQGGSAEYTTLYNGGNGAYTSGYVYLSQGDEVYVYVGGMGVSHSGTSTDTETLNGNGYNGGAAGYFAANNSNAGGGGGATDIRYFGNTTPSSSDLAWNSNLGLNSRIMVAGGGGGAASHSGSPNYSGNGGAGGNLVGQDAQYNNLTCYRYGTGGTQTSGGQSVACSSSYTTSSTGGFGTGGAYYSGGGGGYYGGGGGQHTSAGGGSSFISGYAGCDAITSSSSRVHTGSANHYSGLTFEKGKMRTDIRSGNGYAKIVYVGSEIPVHPLYDVMRTLASSNSNLVTTYSGSSDDTYNENGTNTIYYVKTASKGNTSQAAAILAKINVKFGGFCWQMLRTTDAGGIKLLYNGEPDGSGNCLSPTTSTEHSGLIGINGTNDDFGGDFMYADSFTYDSNGFTLVNPKQDNWNTNKNLTGKYTCKDSNSTCTTLYFLNHPHPTNANKAYFTTYTIGNTKNAQIGTSPFNAYVGSLANSGYKYGNTVYSNAGSGVPADGIIMGHDVYWDGSQSQYILKDTNGNTSQHAYDSSVGQETDYHYTCNSTSYTCTGGKVRYYYYTGGTTVRYTEFKNSDTVETAIQKMLTNSENNHDSAIKAYVENWYVNNLKNYESFIEPDAVYCNDRSVYDPKGFSIDGEFTSLQYAGRYAATSFHCSNTKDRFSVRNTTAELNYPIGLPTYSEISMANNINIYKTGVQYYAISPSYYGGTSNYQTAIGTTGSLASPQGAATNGVRPVITLIAKPGLSLRGNGSLTSPYEIVSN